ncbi:hypothetical protein FHS43_003884 [Streptosporangium becharense]|uniref:Uncharacterized protein n=1 Tax=Streptosporangium becharense TaxID=1816182 RepID=A0A7W9IIA6_9ACTN|nr:hypothetical protein [Streptosporangium becharense]MBB2912601.1 hypothetical protein [Streptosporangium becharense]MBB5820569.1 hypothetical protein [Streptosporangium becharense]
MIAFERRYGGLWCPASGPNRVEYGLDGDTRVYWTAQGWAFYGIVDDDWTWGVEVLLDGRAGMTLADKPLRILNRSVDQRLEAHALFLTVRHWPHLMLELAIPSGMIPVLAGADLPPPVDEASGPADLWWFDGTSAVHLHLNNWWAKDHEIWVARCFSQDATALDRIKASLLNEMTELLQLGEVWCSLCGRHATSGRPCS